MSFASPNIPGNDLALQRYLDEISRIPVLSRAEELTLIPAAQAGDRDAFDTVIRSNLRFVVSIAREYESRGLSLNDLVCEGNLGLFSALKAFDASRGLKFITYAKWWIRQYVVYALIYKSHVVRIPQSQLRKLGKRKSEIHSLEKELQRGLSSSEIERLLGKEASHAVSEGYPVRRFSLNSPIRRESNDSFIDVLPDGQAELPDTLLNLESLRQELRSVFDTLLADREQDILADLFGLKTGQPKTLGEVGETYGLSRERIRQIKNEAIDKIRESRHGCEALLSYLD